MLLLVLITWWHKQHMNNYFRGGQYSDRAGNTGRTYWFIMTWHICSDYCIWLSWHLILLSVCVKVDFFWTFLDICNRDFIIFFSISAINRKTVFWTGSYVLWVYSDAISLLINYPARIEGFRSFDSHNNSSSFAVAYWGIRNRVLDDSC